MPPNKKSHEKYERFASPPKKKTENKEEKYGAVSLKIEILSHDTRTFPYSEFQRNFNADESSNHCHQVTAL